jgi:VanZ family protein
MRLLLALCCCGIVYGSFIPFHFSTDPVIVGQRLTQVTTVVYPFQGGQKNFSISDVVSNVLLYLPFGFFLVGAGLRATPGRSWVGPFLASGALAAAFATFIETGQLFTLDRTASLLDVEANTAGTLIGAIAAHVCFRSVEVGLTAWITRVMCTEPALLPLGLLAFFLSVDSFYPFAITLDVSTVCQNVRHIQWGPLESLRDHLWSHLLMDKVIPWALLMALVHRSLARFGPRRPVRWSAWMLTCLFAGALEVGKLFFAGRVPKVGNVLLAALGALVGGTLLPRLFQSTLVRPHPWCALVALAVVFLAYAELTPFDFTLAPAALATKVAHIEWIPLLSFYGTEPRSALDALFDICQKGLRAGFLGFAVVAATGKGGWHATVVGLLLGMVLEGAQVFMLSHLPSVTDILVFGVGSYGGGVASTRYRAGWQREAQGKVCKNPNSSIRGAAC